MDNQKQDLATDFDKVYKQLDGLKRDVIEKSSLKEMLQIKQALTSEIQNKVDLKEVQQVLNECQNDISEQLTMYKQKINDKIVNQEVSLTRVIERKADVKDLKAALDDGLTRAEALQMFVPKRDFEDIKVSSAAFNMACQEFINKQCKFHLLFHS